MVRWSRIVLWTLVMVMCAGTGLATAMNRNVVLKSGSAIPDGALDESVWASAVWNDFGPHNTHVENGAFKGFSGSFALAYDRDNLYFAFKAVDDKLVGTKSEANIWQDDCIELWLNFKGARAEGLPGYYQVGLAPMSASGGPASWVWRAAPGADTRAMQAIKVASKKTADGWVIEAALAKAGFDGAADNPYCATVNVSIVDRDIEGAGGDANWNHITWNGTDHKDANQFVRMEYR